MTNSKSNSSKASWLAFLVAMLVFATVANAGGRKRVVVLDFDGPKAEKFHDDVVKLIKKSHTVIAVDKWNGAADELDASKVTEKNVKKVAKKLKIDGVVTGKIEKRRDEYIIQLKLRSGTTGEMVGNRIDTKADEARLDGKAQRDVKEELIGAIEELEANHGGGGNDDDDGDAKPKKKKKAADDEADDEDAKPKKGGFGKKKLMDDSDDEADAKPAKKDPKAKKKDADDDDADAKPAKKDPKAKKGATKGEKPDADDDAADAKPAKKDPKAKKKDDKKDDDTAALSTKHDDDESPLPKKKAKSADEGDEEDAKPKKKKRVAKGGDEDDDTTVEASSDDTEKLTKAEALTPANRAVDFTIGMSFTARRLSFTADADLADPPPSYKQSVPVAGGIMDVTVYPMAFSHKNTGIITGLGLEVMYDKVIRINSQKKYVDAMMTQQTADLATVEDRFAIGAVVRYPVSPTFVAGGKLQYSSQQFNIAQTLPNNAPTDVPNVHYSMVEPKGFVHYSVAPQIVVNAELGLMLVTNTGGIQATGTGYGPASVYGYELSGGLDYNLTKNIFIRALVKFETISITFKGDPASLSNTRDTDPMQDVQGAKDVYFGGMGTIGYSY